MRTITGSVCLCFKAVDRVLVWFKSGLFIASTVKGSGLFWSSSVFKHSDRASVLKNILKNKMMLGCSNTDEILKYFQRLQIDASKIGKGSD